MRNLLIFGTMLFTFGFANTQTIWTSETKLKGKIGTNEIEMTLAIPYGGANTCFTIGEYFYLSNKIIISLCSKEDEKLKWIIFSTWK